MVYPHYLASSVICSIKTYNLQRNTYTLKNINKKCCVIFSVFFLINFTHSHTLTHSYVRAFHVQSSRLTNSPGPKPKHRRSYSTTYNWSFKVHYTTHSPTGTSAKVVNPKQTRELQSLQQVLRHQEAGRSIFAKQCASSN